MTVRILVGDCLARLRDLPDESVQCVVTSPPYWGLRDYGTATWEGGDPGCAHKGRPKPRQDTAGKDANGSGMFGETRGLQDAKAVHTIPVRGVCKCGARRIDSQLGLEDTPELYVERMVAVFREVRRVLKKDGTLWLNIGDCYATRSLPGGIKAKDLIGIPWMLAFAMRTDGWFLRSEVVWWKKNPMPESVNDRPTKAHEQLFLFTKSSSYYYDAEAIEEPAVSAGEAIWAGETRVVQGAENTTGKSTRRFRKSGNKERKHRADHGGIEGDTRHQAHSIPWAADGSHRPQYRRALEIAQEKGLTEAHFEAIRACGISDTPRGKLQSGSGRNTPEQKRLAAEAKEALGGYYREFIARGGRNRRTVWHLATKPYKGAHFATFPPALIEPCILAGAPVGAVVLDPFGGAGTTGLVCEQLERESILVELSPEYAKLASDRITGASPLFNSVTMDGAA